MNQTTKGDQMGNFIKRKKLAVLLVSGGALAAPALPVVAQEARLQLEEIVVSATRRQESLQDVPLSVSALSGDALVKSGFQTLQDIQYQFSGVQFGESPNDSGFRLRGVGTAGGFSSSSESNVATVVDNVVIPFGNPVSSLGDLERVEVLKGPQGTQFGKNASSGVVNITTRRPTLDEFYGKVFTSYGSFNEHNANANLNIPLSDTAAAGIYLFDRSYDGYIDNVVLDKDWGAQDSQGFRAKLLWEPSEDLSIYAIGDWSKIEREGPGQLWTINRVPSFANPLMAARFGGLGALGVAPGFGNEKSAEEYESFGSEENFGGSVEISLALGDYDLTSITAYRETDQGLQQFAIDGSPVAVFTAQQAGTDQKFYSQELRLSSPSGEDLEYITGVYLSRRETGDSNDFNRAQLRPAAPFNPFIVNISAGQSISITESDSAAVFFDGTYRLTDNLSAVGGIRYQWDWVEAESYSIIDPNFAPSPPGPPVPGQVNFYQPRALATGETDDRDWSGRIGFEYTPSEDVMLFATMARGYLGPTVTFSGLTGLETAVGPQTVVDYTVGVKSQLFDHRLTLNANIFYDKYEDMQTSVFNGLEFLTESAGGFEARGFEADATWLALDNLTLNASYTYSDTEFTDYITACPATVTAQGAAAVAALCNAPGSVPGTPLYDAEGEPLSGAPKHSATLGFNYDQPVGDQLVFDASANVYYRSEVQYTVGNGLAAQDGYTTVGLNLGIGDAGESWRVGLFARNLFDELFHAAVITLPFSDPGGYVNWHTREGRRTFGASLEVTF